VLSLLRVSCFSPTGQGARATQSACATAAQHRCILEWRAMAQQSRPSASSPACGFKGGQLSLGCVGSWTSARILACAAAAALSVSCQQHAAYASCFHTWCSLHIHYPTRSGLGRRAGEGCIAQPLVTL
jgi:hypothetical protein